MNINMDHLKSPSEIITEVMTRIYDLRLTTPSGGNISMMDEEDVIWVTPSQVDKGRLTPDDIVKILPGGRMEGKHKPSMEYRFHQEIYHVRPDIRAVIHAHPPGLVTYSLTGCVLNHDVIPSLYPNTENIGISHYAIPGSHELGKNVGNAFSTGCHSAFMENHGIITTGWNLWEAFYRIESMEALASILIDSAGLGEILKPSAGDLEFTKIEGIHETIGKQEFLFADYEQNIRESLADFVKRAYRRSLFTAVAGGFSARIDESGFLVTPEGKDIHSLEPCDLVLIRDGRSEEGKTPSQFTPLHDAIYSQHNFVNSIASAHPRSVMAFAVTGKKLDTRTIPESYLLLNEIPLVPFPMRFTAPCEVARLITPRFPAVLIENDCITVTGDSPFQVFDRLEVAEFTARSILNARPLGPARRLTDQESNDLEKSFS
jgi:L-fuculose-phosphate aldolase